MRKLARILLLKPVLWFANKFSSRPDKKRIFKALSKLKRELLKKPAKKGPCISFDINKGRFIIFSDQHKGGRNGADDFMFCEPNYITALDYYNERNFFFISLGDSEELWENRWPKVKESNVASYESEKRFAKRDAFVKIFGNHDLAWNTDLFTSTEMKKVYDCDVKVYEAAMLHTEINSERLYIFCTHGHQGDKQSDGNWFSKFFVAHIWAPLQAYLKINPNTPAYNTTQKTLHNRIMYEWSARQRNTILITGHTHQPVFESLTELERLYRKLLDAEAGKDIRTIEEIKTRIRIAEPGFTAVSSDYLEMEQSYFNTGCCCFSDGDITGIEIEDGKIRLIKWGKLERIILEETNLSELFSPHTVL